MKTTIIIPTYNERENIVPLVEEILQVTPDVGVLVVDDNSPDGTADAVRELSRRFASVTLLSRPNKKGLGAAYVAAFRALLKDESVEQFVTMDADFSHDPKHLPALLAANNHAELVVGSRYILGGGIVKWELWRRQLSYWANKYVKTILREPINDWTTGYQCIKTSALRRIDFDAIDLSGYAFLQELKYALVSAGATVAEVPIMFQSRREGESKISAFIIWEGVAGPWRMRRRTTVCRVCGVKDARRIGSRNGYGIYRSHSCGTVFISPVPSDTSSVYGADYFHGAQQGFGYANYEADKKAHEPTFLRYIDRIKKYAPSDATLLDVGAANGYFLRLAMRQGFHAKGVELSSHATAEARALGLDVRQGTLQTLADADGSYHIITMWDVLEHVTNPRDTLRRAHSLLCPGGTLAINTPDSSSLWARLWGAHWHLVVPPEHLTLFSRTSLTRLLREEGFEVQYTGTIGKSFSLPYVLSILSSWTGVRAFNRISAAMRNSWLSRMSVPINLRDNMFIVATRI